MRHCLTCNADYLSDSVQTCPDCGGRTIDEEELALWNQIRADLSDEHFVPVRVFDGPVDKAFITEIFDDNEVPFVVHDPQTLAEAFQVHSGFGVLLVAEDMVGKARVLLREYDESVVPTETGDGPA